MVWRQFFLILNFFLYHTIMLELHGWMWIIEKLLAVELFRFNLLPFELVILIIKPWLSLTAAEKVQWARGNILITGKRSWMNMKAPFHALQVLERAFVCQNLWIATDIYRRSNNTSCWDLLCNQCFVCSVLRWWLPKSARTTALKPGILDL